MYHKNLWFYYKDSHTNLSRHRLHNGTCPQSEWRFAKTHSLEVSSKEEGKGENKKRNYFSINQLCKPKSPRCMLKRKRQPFLCRLQIWWNQVWEINKLQMKIGLRRTFLALNSKSKTFHGMSLKFCHFSQGYIAYVF